MTKPGLPLAERFMLSVEKTEGCWLWRAGGWPYGKFALDGKRKVKASRAAFELFNGPIPAGAWVLHTCDNPVCVNPEHLYLGDRARNMKDAHERGRIDLRRVAAFPRPGAAT